MKRRILSIFLIIVMVIGFLPTNAIMVSASTAPSIAVNVSKKIDVALAVGPTDVDYSNFSEDLTNALIKLGNISEENINVSKLEASNVGTSGNFAWWTYDHTVPTSIINEQTHEYIELTAPANNNGHAYYSLPRHIIVTNNGADLGFRGYGVSGNKDFMFIENDDPTKKTFQFDIEEGEAYDALDGVGFLFNTNLTGSYTANGQLMSGYLLFLQYSTSGRGQEISLYKFSNVNTKSFHEGNPGLISNNPAFTKLASAPYSSIDKYRKVKIEVSPQKVKVWYKGSTTAITTDLINSDIVSFNVNGNNQTEVIIQPTGAYGFGPIGSYRAHNCNLLTSIDFKNLTMSTEEPKTLTEVIREPQWESESLKYIVNLNDQHINDFDDPRVTSEIINRLNNDDVYYVGWGSNENEEQTDNFLKLNDLKGDFVNTDSTDINTYQKQIDEIAYSILERYTNEIQGNTAHVLTTDNVNLVVSGADANDTIDPNWPNGKWKVVHTKEGFSNVTEEYIGNGQYVSDLNVNFNIPGKYEIFYEDNLIKTIVANRRPIAAFDTVVTGSAISLNVTNEESEDSNIPVVIGDDTENGVSVASGAAITYINMSYDPDDADGIDQSKNSWKYINLSDPNPQWVESATPITHINADDIYLVSLVVTDKFGATSIPFTKQISYTTEGIKVVPFADFELSTSKIIKGNADQFVTINDKSYDLYNEAIERYYTITKDGQPYEKEIKVGLNDFTLDTEGVYKISLVVHSVNGYSQKITKTLTIIKDEIAPTATCNVSNGTETGLSRVDIQFSDLGNSGFGSQQVMITNTTDTPDADSPNWSAPSSLLNRTVYLKNDGENYIHYRAVDLAGNVITGYFGPIIYEANNPYVSAIISPIHNAVDQSIKTSIAFQASEKVKKGNGYLTIYDKLTGKSVMQIHSSNNRVKISNTGLVTVELPSALSYNSSYYVTVGTDFIYDESNKGIAQYGDANNWSFTTATNRTGTTDEDITITKVEASQTIGGVTTTPVINIDPTTTNTYNVYVKAGEFTLLPFLSKVTENITIAENNCTATLSEDKKSILVDLSNGAINPWVTLNIGNSNSYLFKIVQTDKEIGAAIDITTTDVNVSVGNSNLLNAVDLTAEMSNAHVERVHVRLLISEPQVQAEQDALKAYIDNNTNGEKSVLFDASLLKTITYDNSLPSEMNIVNTQEPIKIVFDIPSMYQRNYSYQIIRYHDSAIDELESSVLNNGTQLSFETDRFSTYAIVYTSAPVYSGPDAVQEEVVSEQKEVSVPKTITVTAGKTKSIEITNLPEGAIVNYHVNTPTIISLDKNGVMFPKKAGNAEVYVSVKTNDKTQVYKVTVKIKKSKVEATSVGFIQYYDDIVTYKNVNYRITKASVNGAIGTVAVANNQINSKLPSELVIPAKVKIDGHYYYVTTIDESAFYNVKTLKKVTIPYSIKEISQTAFIGCKVLKVFSVSKDNKNYSARNGMLLDKSGTVLIAYPSATGKITVDSKITTIGAYAFSVCRGLTQVTIPSTVKTIEGCAFAHSKSLVKVKFTGDVPTMPYPCIFDSINSKAVIYVKGAYLTNYQKAFTDAEMPTGVVIKK
ncbi:MAG: hypothetical protein K0S41_2964 [Anaerocolumna sp.]|nr:hypothetical protein [Anaerocolumna sp.]